MTRPRRALMASVILLPALAALAARAQDPVSDDEREEQVARGRLVFDNSCRMCHEPTLVHQQRLTPAQWDAEIEKMTGWGATVAPEEVPALRAFLNTHFGPENAAIAATRVTPLPKPAMQATDDATRRGRGDAARGAAAHAQHCATCHGTEGRGGEPGQNLVEQEVLLDPEGFAAVVRAGRNKMPAYAEVLDAGAIEDLRTWLLTLRYEPVPQTP